MVLDCTPQAAAPCTSPAPGTRPTLSTRTNCAQRSHTRQCGLAVTCGRTAPSLDTGPRTQHRQAWCLHTQVNERVQTPPRPGGGRTRTVELSTPYLQNSPHSGRDG